MPALHAALRHRVHPALEERSFLACLVRVMLVGSVWPRFRNRSLLSA
jgi:hypothetical protein